MAVDTPPLTSPARTSPTCWPPSASSRTRPWSSTFLGAEGSAGCARPRRRGLDERSRPSARQPGGGVGGARWPAWPRSTRRGEHPRGAPPDLEAIDDVAARSTPRQALACSPEGAALDDDEVDDLLAADGVELVRARRVADVEGPRAAGLDLGLARRARTSCSRRRAEPLRERPDLGPRCGEHLRRRRDGPGVDVAGAAVRGVPEPDFVGGAQHDAGRACGDPQHRGPAVGR